MKTFNKLFIAFFLLISFNKSLYAMEDIEQQNNKIFPIRQSSRLIILDSQNRLLLMQLKLENSAITEPYWVTLGGGVNTNESLEEAAERELAEETGIKNAKIGPKIWHGQWQGTNRINDETYFLIKLPYVGGEVDNTNLEEEEKKVIKAMKWWSIEELQKSNEIFIPQQLAFYLSTIIKGEIPSSPIEIDLSTPKENK